MLCLFIFKSWLFIAVSISVLIKIFKILNFVDGSKLFIQLRKVMKNNNHISGQYISPYLPSHC